MALYYFWYLDSLFEIADKFDVADCTVKRSVDAVSGGACILFCKGNK